METRKSDNGSPQVVRQINALKIARLLRTKGEKFLSFPEEYVSYLMEIISHFHSGADTIQCLLAIDMISQRLLQEKRMLIEVIPLKPVENTPENEFKQWLKKMYEEWYETVVSHLENSNSDIQMQALRTAMNIIANEGKNPLENNGTTENWMPISKLKAVLIRIVSSKQNNLFLIQKYTEYLQYDDIMFYTWKILPSLIFKQYKPNEVYKMNLLILLEKLQIDGNSNGGQYLCLKNENESFQYDVSAVKRAFNKMWPCIMHWELTPQVHKQILLVLDNNFAYLDKPLLMTDYLMDSLDSGGAVSLLALQGIFKLIQDYNLDYPNIFIKLYSMFEPEIFHLKYKARLIYLSDLFLSSTHLPETLVAAFAKRLARLTLVAPTEDIIIICSFISNLIIRHPGLKRLVNNQNEKTASSDPYIMDERDPMQSNAISSSLWEIETLQNHVLPQVAIPARVLIQSPLPSTEFDLSSILDKNGEDIFDKEIKKLSKSFALNFYKPTLSDKSFSNYWSI